MLRRRNARPTKLEVDDAADEITYQLGTLRNRLEDFLDEEIPEAEWERWHKEFKTEARKILHSYIDDFFR